MALAKEIDNLLFCYVFRFQAAKRTLPPSLSFLLLVSVQLAWLLQALQKIMFLGLLIALPNQVATTEAFWFNILFIAGGEGSEFSCKHFNVSNFRQKEIKPLFQQQKLFIFCVWF